MSPRFEGPPGLTPLQSAVIADSKDIVNALIAAGADVDQTDDSGTTPLYLASMQGDAAMVSLLLAAGADSGKADLQGRFPLHRAALGNDVKIVSALLAAGTPTDHQDGEHGYTALHMAAMTGSAEAAAALLKAGSDPDSTDKAGCTPLFVAACCHRTEVVAKLLTAGAAVDKCDGTGSTPLHVAITEGEPDTASLLVPSFNLDYVGVKGNAGIAHWSSLPHSSADHVLMFTTYAAILVIVALFNVDFTIWHARATCGSPLQLAQVRDSIPPSRLHEFLKVWPCLRRWRSLR